MKKPEMTINRTVPFYIYFLFLPPILILAFYFSVIFKMPELNMTNIGDMIVKGCYKYHFNPIKIFNEKTGPCMGIGLIAWIFLASYMMTHFRNFQSGSEHGAEDWADPDEVSRRHYNNDIRWLRIISRNVQIDTQGKCKLSNNNMIVIGASGAYKTTSIVTPNILKGVANQIVLDVKGELYYKYGLYLQNLGYSTPCLNLKDMSRSDRYNPFLYIVEEKDVIDLIEQIYDALTPPKSAENDPFWPEGAKLYLQSLFFYVWITNKISKSIGTMNDILDLVNDGDIPDPNSKPDKNGKRKSKLESKMDALEKELPGNPASRDYNKLCKDKPQQTIGSIVMIVNAKLKLFQISGVKRIFSGDDIKLKEFGTGVGGTVDHPNLNGRKVLFLIVDDQLTEFNFICSMVYSQALSILCRMADFDFKKDYGGGLPIPLELWMDEFYKGARPHDTAGLFGIVRSRNISLIPIIQSYSQLVDLFGSDQKEIIFDNVSAVAFLGAGVAAMETHKFISEMLGQMTIDTYGDSKQGQQQGITYSKMGQALMSPQQVRKMNKKHCIIFMEEEGAIYDRKALPWEDEVYSTRKMEKMDEKLKEKAKKEHIPYYNPYNHFKIAMELNKANPDGGLVHPIVAVADRFGQYHQSDDNRHPIEDIKDLPEGSKCIHVTDQDLVSGTVQTYKQSVNKAADVFNSMYVAFRKSAKKQKKQMTSIVLPKDRDVSGSIADVLNRYVKDLTPEEMHKLIALLKAGEPEGLVKELIKLPKDQMDDNLASVTD